MESKKSTIYTISKELGLSPSTVSRAFNPSSKISDETRKMILEFAKEKNYEPNVAAARLSMKVLNIGVIISNSYLPAAEEFIRGISSSYRSNSDLKINLEYRITGDTDEEDSLKGALSDFRGFDAVITSGFVDGEYIDLLRKYIDSGGKIVFLQCDVPEIKSLFASYHDTDVANRMTAEYIRDCLRFTEKKNVVLITDSRTMETQKETAIQFENAVKEYGLSLIGSYDMDGSPKRLRKITEKIFASDIKPDAVYITSGKSDELCRYINENNLVGRVVLVTYDVNDSVVGYLGDGTVWATVNQSYYNQAKKAFTRLVRCLVGTAEPENMITFPELVFKESIKSIKKNPEGK